MTQRPATRRDDSLVTEAARGGLGWLEVSLLLLIAASLVLELVLVFRLNLNWDEFHFLSRVYEYQRGALPYRLQTFHVHLFQWLPRVSASEVEQVLAARCAIFALGLGTRVWIYRIGRHFLPPVGALFAVLAYGSFSYVLHHGTSFRFDPLCSFLVLGAIVLLLPSGRPVAAARTAVAGLAFALAGMISLKSAVLLPAVFAALAFGGVRDGNLRESLYRALIFATASIAGFGVLYALHAQTLVSEEFDAGAFVSRVGGSFLVLDELAPRSRYLVQSLTRDGLVWCLLAVGTAIAVAQLRDASKRVERGALLGFLLPLAALAVYRNAYPYFYVMILAPAIVLAGIPIGVLAGRGASRARGAFVVALACGVFAGGLRFFWENREDQTAIQRAHVDAVHTLFPSPVPYIDRCGMIASYPKAGMFLSGWSLADYRAAGRPVMEEVIANDRPVFLLANSAGLAAALATRPGPAPIAHRLLEADNRALRENYIWHWGVLFVAGKRFPPHPDGPRRFELLIPGLYTIESQGAVRIDGVLYQPGSHVQLETGHHTLQVEGRPSAVSLRWGRDLQRPATPATHERIFRGFTYRPAERAPRITR